MHYGLSSLGDYLRAVQLYFLKCINSYYEKPRVPGIH